MAVIVADANNTSYTGNLSTTNGFYRAEAFNVGFYGANLVSLATTRVINVNFANAGNCQGVLINLFPGGSQYSTQKNVSVTLKLSGATLASTTLTPTQITNYSSNTYIFYASGWITPFKFSSPPAITTATGVYTIEIAQTGAAANSWITNTSDGTNVPYVTWCDNQITATSGSDALILVDRIAINQSFTTKAYLGTGDTTYGISCIIARSATPATSTVANLVWATTPAAGYNFSVDGIILFGAHSGFQAGTSSSRVPFTQKGTFSFINTPTLGSQKGFRTLVNGNTNSGQASIQIFGEIPSSTRVARLASNALTTSNTISLVTAPTGWQIGDRLLIPKLINQNQNDKTLYVISAISGTTITLTTNLGVATHYADSPVINYERYGFLLTVPNVYSAGFLKPNNFTLSGCEISNYVFDTKIQSGQWVDDAPSNMSQYTVSDSVFSSPNSGQFIVSSFDTPSTGILFQNFYTNGAMMPGQSFTSQGDLGIGSASGNVSVVNCIMGSTASASGNFVRGANPVLTGNEFYGSLGNVNQPCLIFGDGNYPVFGLTFNNNKIWGAGSPLGIANIFNTTSWSSNSINNCGNPYIFYTGSSKNNISTGDFYGTEFANTANVYMANPALVDFEISNFTGSLAFDTTTQKKLVEGSQFKITNYNLTANDDRVVLKYGNYQRTGFGLGDTTIWNGTAFTAASAGQFGLRMAPNDGTNLLTYQDNNGSTTIGNCQGLPVQVSVRIKINNAAYYAGTFILPRLKVTYDGTTIITNQATASTAGQQLQVSFSPTTIIQAITIQIEGATNATGSNAYFYVGEVVYSTPGGVLVDTTRLGSFSHALPLGTFRTFPGNQSVLSEILANFNVANTVGSALNTIPTINSNVSTVNTNVNTVNTNVSAVQQTVNDNQALILAS